MTWKRDRFSAAGRMYRQRLSSLTSHRQSVSRYTLRFDKATRREHGCRLR